ncbi:MAG: N-acetyltransferase [Sphingobacteriales bacterium]|nr:MAG: N-acetyltransferase [Sphingobacteriales bacterium]
MSLSIPAIRTIETERLLLKEITPEFWDYAFSNWSDEELINYFAYADLPAEKEKNRMGLQTYHISFRNFVIVVKDTGQTLGRIGFHTWYTHHNRAEIGYGIEDPSQRGKDYVSEALKALLIYGFEELGLHRAEALTGTDNQPSIKALLKYGFQLEGVLRGHYNVDGEQVDSNCYSLLKPEYEKLKDNW